eukprot:TRINITY_DN46330_c0_g1_i1.p1 TRINITY_DN46330_c0_g1~~TRINITY_DN46330_c0_g1_i1.p1  ORF type:complete len:164 (+),score=9.76 TRINITY_DN46330_c0_g1_i1:86-577(+)
MGLSWAKYLDPMHGRSSTPSPTPALGSNSIEYNNGEVANTTQKTSYDPLEKLAIAGIIESATIGTLLALSRHPAMRRGNLSAVQTNRAIGAAFALPWVCLAIQKAYYDTLLELRGLKPQGNSFGSAVNLSFLSPSTFTWDIDFAAREAPPDKRGLSLMNDGRW